MRDRHQTTRHRAWGRRIAGAALTICSQAGRIRIGACVFLLVGLVATASTPLAAAGVQSNPAPLADARYTLGTGDRIRVTVYGQDDLSGEFEIDGTGMIGMPLLGPLRLGGLDLGEAEGVLAAALRDGYLVDPRVSVDVLNYRPFYILGEVKAPGSYAYVNGMTVLTAVALAGGFTYRAAEKRIKVTRRKDGIERAIRISQSDIILPGDIIRVPERIF